MLSTKPNSTRWAIQFLSFLQLVTLSTNCAWSQQQSPALQHPCEITWKRVLVVNPTPDANVDAYKAEAKQQLVNNGYTADLAESTASEMARALAMSSKGMKQFSVLKFTRSSEVARCDIVSESPQFVGGKADYKSALTTDYSDGKNFVSLDVIDNETTPIHAQLSREIKKEFKDIGNDYGIIGYLSLQSWDRYFPEINGKQLVQPNVSSEVVHRVESTPPIQHKALLNNSRTPIQVQSFHVNRLTSPFKVWKADKFEVVGDSAYLPHHISVESFNEAGKQLWRADYELIKSSFGRDVDLTVLDIKKILPKGTLLSDSRFGDDKAVLYKIRSGGFPGDVTVAKLVNKRGDSSKRTFYENQAVIRNFALPVGLIFLIGGLFWFRRTRQVKA